MKYNGFYFWMFKSPMKKVLAEKYGREYAADIMKKSKKVYRELVEKADDIGDDNPMAYNELFALAFVAPYVASEKKIPPTTVQEMMRRSLYHIKWYFAKTDLNTGVPELMPLFCELDEVMITLQHGVLHRKQTLANGGEYCDYFITGNRE